MVVLLSIKPGFAEKILSGEKRFEYRRSLFREMNVSKVVMYATKPMGLIVGEFYIDRILEGPPETIWEGTKQYSGISKPYFASYFAGKDKAFAIKIKNVKKYDRFIDPYAEKPNFTPPQSFCYMHDWPDTEENMSLF